MSAENSLDDALKLVKKQFGAGAVMTMATSAASKDVEVISTGSKDIDEITGIGGIPRGRITEVFGPEAGGKSTLCLQIVAQAQKLGTCLYIDAEHALDVNYAKALGVDIDSLLICQPSNGEEALEIALTMIKSGAIIAVAVDSVAHLVPKAELENDMGQPTMGLMARLMGSAMRKLIDAVAQSGTCLIFVNQVRDKLGIMFGNPETTPGGRALKFASSMRIDLRRISQIKKGDNIIGQNVKVKILKNKLSAPYRDTETRLIYGQGFINTEKK